MRGKYKSGFLYTAPGYISSTSKELSYADPYLHFDVSSHSHPPSQPIRLKEIKELIGYATYDILKKTVIMPTEINHVATRQ